MGDRGNGGPRKWGAEGTEVLSDTAAAVSSTNGNYLLTSVSTD